MAVIVKCDWREMTPDNKLVIDRAWVYQDCVLKEGDETFVWWHERSAQDTHLALRGMLSSVSYLGKSPTNHRPEVSLQIDIVDSSPNRQLLIDAVDEKADRPALRTLWRKLCRNRWTKVACLDKEETEYLRDFFHDWESIGDLGAQKGYEQDRTIGFRQRNPHNRAT